MRQHQDELDALGVRVAVVTFEMRAAAQAYIRETELPWPMLVDASRELYAAYGMEKGSWWDIYGPSAWWIYAKLLFKGRRLKRSHGDYDQLGGDVLIDPFGIVRMHHIGAGPADRPSVAAILERVRHAVARP